MKIEYVTYKLINGDRSYFNQTIVRAMAGGGKILKQCWCDGLLIGQYRI